MSLTQEESSRLLPVYLESQLTDPSLRGIAWSAMGWASYQTGEHAPRNMDILIGLSEYLDLGFARSLSEPCT